MAAGLIQLAVAIIVVEVHPEEYSISPKASPVEKRSFLRGYDVSR